MIVPVISEKWELNADNSYSHTDGDDGILKCLSSTRVNYRLMLVVKRGGEMAFRDDDGNIRQVVRMLNATGTEQEQVLTIGQAFHSHDGNTFIADEISETPVQDLGDWQMSEFGIYATRYTPGQMGHHFDVYKIQGDTSDGMFGEIQEAFEALWNEKHDIDGQRFADNPTVWVISLRNTSPVENPYLPYDYRNRLIEMLKDSNTILVWEGEHVLAPKPKLSSKTITPKDDHNNG